MERQAGLPKATQLPFRYSNAACLELNHVVLRHLAGVAAVEGGHRLVRDLGQPRLRRVPLIERRLQRRRDGRGIGAAREIARTDATSALVAIRVGPERAMLYRVALESGLRAGELRSLVVGSFKLRGQPATITVKASYSKRRREDTRSACELFYHLFAPELGERFSQAMFDDFVRRYMGDDRAEEVARSLSLQEETGMARQKNPSISPEMRSQLNELQELLQQIPPPSQRD